MTTRLKGKIQYFEAGAARQNTKICINIIHVNGSAEDHTSQKASKHKKKTRGFKVGWLVASQKIRAITHKRGMLVALFYAENVHPAFITYSLYVFDVDF